MRHSAGLKLARYENLQSRVKEEDSITNVENAVFDLGVMDPLCFLFIDQRVLIGMITKSIVSFCVQAYDRTDDHAFRTLTYMEYTRRDLSLLACAESQSIDGSAWSYVDLGPAPTAYSLDITHDLKGDSPNRRRQLELEAWVNFILRVSKCFNALFER
ncbi:hypothetical protein Tco_1163839 [Tanacetum coccineum]